MEEEKPKQNNNIDLLDLGDFNTGNDIMNNNNNMNANKGGGINDLLSDLNNIDLGGGGGGMMPNNNNMNIQRFVVREENSPGVSNPNKGLEVEASVFNNNNNFFLSIVLKNKSAGMPINNFVIQFNNNPFGLSINPNCLSNINLMPGQISENNIPLNMDNPSQMPEPGQSTIQTGLRCNLNEYYCYIGALLGAVELIKSGTTTFSDMYFFVLAHIGFIDSSSNSSFSLWGFSIIFLCFLFIFSIQIFIFIFSLTFIIILFAFFIFTLGILYYIYFN